MMIKLYGVGFSNNVSKVRYCLHYLGLEYEWIQTNPIEGETQTEEYLAINPTGKIPAVKDNGLTIFESNAINRYFASKENSPIYPQDFRNRVVVDQWIDFPAIHIFHAMARVFFNRCLAPMMGREVDEGSIKAGLEFLERFLPVCEKQLGKNKFLTGGDFTLADINLLAILDPFELMQVSLEPYPNISKWRNDLKSQAFYQKCYRDYGQFVQEMMNSQTTE